MSVLVDRNTKVVVQGITGSAGKFHAAQMVEYGTRVVAGVTPGKGGMVQDGIPVFDTMEEAVSKVVALVGEAASASASGRTPGSSCRASPAATVRSTRSR